MKNFKEEIERLEKMIEFEKTEGYGFEKRYKYELEQTLKIKKFIENILKNMGTFNCGYMNSVDSCDRIDIEELNKELFGVKNGL